jgi:hypothetical protein
MAGADESVAFTAAIVDHLASPAAVRLLRRDV